MPKKSIPELLHELTSKPHVITIKRAELTPRETDAVHRALLAKQRKSGSLGLNQ